MLSLPAAKRTHVAAAHRQAQGFWGQAFNQGGVGAGACRGKEDVGQ
jgi:hypothetical protein